MHETYMTPMMDICKHIETIKERRDLKSAEIEIEKCVDCKYIVSALMFGDGDEGKYIATEYFFGFVQAGRGL